MPSAPQEDSGAELSEAIEALREALRHAWLHSGTSNLRFRLAPAELTLQLGVTRTDKGSAGIKWQVLTLGGERARQIATTQTLKLTFVPVLLDRKGDLLPDAEQMISTLEEEASHSYDEDSLRHQSE